MSGERERRGPSSAAERLTDSEDHLGALETDQPGQEGQGNPNVAALDENGQPSDWVKICEDVIGANEDDSQG